MAANTMPYDVVVHGLALSAAETRWGAVVFTVNVEVTGVLPVICTELAEQEASSMAAGTVQVNVIVPVKPPTGVIVRGLVAGVPGVALNDDGAAGKLKSPITYAAVATALLE